MNNQSRVLAGVIVGAVVGAAAGYLFLTDSGRELRDRVEPAVDEVRRELRRLQRTAEKVGEIADEVSAFAIMRS